MESSRAYGNLNAKEGAPTREPEIPRMVKELEGARNRIANALDRLRGRLAAVTTSPDAKTATPGRPLEALRAPLSNDLQTHAAQLDSLAVQIDDLAERLET